MIGKTSVAKIVSMICVFVCILSCVSLFAYAEENDVQGASDGIPEGAKRLIEVYPEQSLRYVDGQIIFSDGTAMIYDDGKSKSFDEKLDQSDIEDMFSLTYSLAEKPDYLQDAGRSRCEPFFKKMYGSSKAEVRKQLVLVPWFGKRVKFTKVNGAAEQLRKVAEEIERDYPEMIKYMESSGTFVWRKVRGAQRMSSHSYGIAIDIGVPFSDYWQWAYGKVAETAQIGYKNKIPLEIVRVFEKHGFVWGGRWYHFDTMHFEYRPEIVYDLKE